MLFPKTVFDHVPDVKSNEYSALLKSSKEPSFMIEPISGLKTIFCPILIVIASFASSFTKSCENEKNI